MTPQRHNLAHDLAKPIRGFTLIEMMVAMIISIFLTMALAGIYNSLKRSFFSEDGISQTQENLRLALTTLTNSIQAAGYFPDPVNNNAGSVFPTNTTFTTAGQFILGTSVSGSPQTLTVRYQTQDSDGILNCAGAENKTGAKAILTNTFSVNSNGELTCTTTINSATPTSVVLARNISKIEFLYATDKVNNDGQVDSYLSAADAATTGWNKVYAVRIELTLLDTINSNAAAKQDMPSKIIQYVNLMNTYASPT